MMKKSGFTLAEVLITLGIIGVVASMTIPNLIANTNSAKFRSGAKKSISTLAQAGLMGMAQFDVDYSGITTACTSTPKNDILPANQTICGLLNSTLTGTTMVTNSPYSSAGVAFNGGPNVGTTATGAAGISNVAWLQMADGVIFAFSRSAQGCTITGQLNATKYGELNSTSANCRGYIDVNGTTLPNKEVNCGSTETAGFQDGTCIVHNNNNEMTDIFPVVFHDGQVEPYTRPARYVLTTSK